jgi:hypothetical protein
MASSKIEGLYARCSAGGCGVSRRIWVHRGARGTSAFERITEASQTSHEVRNVPILLQKSAAADGLSVILFNGDRL